MNISQAGVDLIKSFEGCRLTPYFDSVGVLTNGWGNTHDVTRGEVITQDQADADLLANLQRFVQVVNEHLTTEVTQNQFDALCSFCYNCGPTNLINSTLLKMVNAGDADAGDQFLKWDHAGGKVLAGLTRRREAEAALFRGDE